MKPPILLLKESLLEYRIPKGYTAEQVRTKVEHTLLKTECVTLKRYCERFWRFEVEYGTKPPHIENPDIDYRFIHKRNYCAKFAADKARHMFAHNFASLLPEEDSEEDEPDSKDEKWIITDYENRREWTRCAFDINRRLDANGEEFLVIVMIRLNNLSRPSAWYIFGEIQTELTEANLHWEKRRNYVGWMEGTTIAEGQGHREDNTRVHILKYLFSPWMQMEICAYM